MKEIQDRGIELGWFEGARCEVEQWVVMDAPEYFVCDLPERTTKGKQGN